MIEHSFEELVISARALIDGNRPAEAAALLQRACVPSAPPCVPGLLAEAQLATGRYVEAKESAESAIAGDPHNARWRFLAGRAAR
jgi:hypothetical protein